MIIMKFMFIRFHQIFTILLCTLFSGIAGAVPHKELINLYNPTAIVTKSGKSQSEIEKTKLLCSSSSSSTTEWHRENCLYKIPTAIVTKSGKSRSEIEKTRLLCSSSSSPTTEWHRENCLYKIPTAIVTKSGKSRSEIEKTRLLCFSSSSPTTEWHRENCLYKIPTAIVTKSGKSQSEIEKTKLLCSSSSSPTTEWHRENCLYSISQIYNKHDSVVLQEGDRVRASFNLEPLELEVFHHDESELPLCTIIKSGDTFEVAAFNATVTDTYPYYVSEENDQEEVHNIVVRKVKALVASMEEDTACPENSYAILPLEDKCAGFQKKGVPAAHCSLETLSYFFGVGFFPYNNN